MGNMFSMIKQAMSMQRELKNVQKQLEKQTVEYTWKGGLIKVTARGDMAVQSIKIDPQIINAADQRRLEDGLVSAVNSALAEAKAKAAKEMAKLTAGMGLPGMPGM